jgi:N-glycosylase/DNA lyase
MINNLIKIECIKTSMDNSQNIISLQKLWLNIYHILKSREKHFYKIWVYGTDMELFLELIFCILTPQSKAVLCWEAVKHISSLLSKRINSKDILEAIKHIRFYNNKTQYIIKAINFFTENNVLNVRSYLKSFDNIYHLREWLVNNIKGIGYKEASHFLRNIGIGLELAILDRHILNNLKIYNIIDVIPKHITKKLYLIIESKMQIFSKKINIPMCHLDMLLWCKYTGYIFK